MKNYHDIKLNELSEEIVSKSVESLSTYILPEDKLKIVEEYTKDQETWWALYHHGWGTAIRNHLRDTVCLDDRLPDKNWDDYYIPLVEIVCGIRQYG